LIAGQQVICGISGEKERERINVLVVNGALVPEKYRDLTIIDLMTGLMGQSLDIIQIAIGILETLLKPTEIGEKGHKFLRDGETHLIAGM